MDRSGRGRGKRVGREKERLIWAWSSRKVTGRYPEEVDGESGEGSGVEARFMFGLCLVRFWT